METNFPCFEFSIFSTYRDILRQIWKTALNQIKLFKHPVVVFIQNMPDAWIFKEQLMINFYPKQLKK